VNISGSVRFCEVANVGKIVNERVSVSFGEVVSGECVPKCLSEGKSECVS
jgi:hypothetical protein